MCANDNHANDCQGLDIHDVKQINVPFADLTGDLLNRYLITVYTANIKLS